MNPEAKEGKIETKAEFIITMTWPDDHPDDIDLYAEDPLGNIVWYHVREGGFMVLDRDDRGGANNTITVDGRKITSPFRQETISIRGIVPGEYTVNVHYFLATKGGPVPVIGQGREDQPDRSRSCRMTTIIAHAHGRGEDRGALPAGRRRQCRRRQPSRQITDPAHAQRPPHAQVTRAKGDPMTATLLAISAAYVVLAVCCCCRWASRRASPGG